MTVREVLNEAAKLLAVSAIESPRLEAELLLAHVLNKPRLRLYLESDRVLAREEESHFRELIQLRNLRIPSQYIIGTACFLGYELKVAPGVLVPRPETEILVQLALKDLKERMAMVNTFRTGPLRVLDYGTGSGCVAIAIAIGCDECQVVAIDRSNLALSIAAENVDRHHLRKRITLAEGDGFDALGGTESAFDVIVTNPPYIPTAEIPLLAPEVRDHEPRSALDGGLDGLDFHRALSREAAHWLKSGGTFLAEFGDEQGAALKLLFSVPPWEGVRLEKDLSGKERVLIVRSRLRDASRASTEF